MATRRRHLTAVPDPRPRCRICRDPIDPAATAAGEWVTQPDGTQVWRQTGRYSEHPTCAPTFTQTRTATA